MNNDVEIHYMPEKVRGNIGATTCCGKKVSRDNIAWVADDWDRVTCPACLKRRPVETKGGLT